MQEVVCQSIDINPYLGYSPSMSRSKKVILILIVIIGATPACSLRGTLPLAATATPFVPPVPTETPPATSTPTPTLTLTLTPRARIASGDRALYNGDWDTALQEYQHALDTKPDSDIQTAALLGIGRVQIFQGDISSVLNTLENIVEGYPNSPHLAETYFYLGQTFRVLDRHREAADAYQYYLNNRPGLIDTYVQEWRGDALVENGDYQGAMDAYHAALEAPHLGKAETIHIKNAQAFTAIGDYENALTILTKVDQSTSNDNTRAQVNLLRGQILSLQGDTEEANHLYLESVANYPLSYASYLGLVDLVDRNVPVDELDRGLVNYFVGQYDLAIAAFDRLLSNADLEHDGTTHYYKALSLRNLNAYQAAIDEWDNLIATHPISDRFWADAWEKKGLTQWAFLDQYDQAIQTFLDFADQYPDHLRAGDFLFFAAQVAERDGQLERAAELWERVEAGYPSHFLAYRARFLAGVAHYRLDGYAQAIENFSRTLEIATTPQEQAAASLWIGKTQAAGGNPEVARLTWENTASIDPTGYYSERARDLLLGRIPFEPPQVYDLAIDWDKERSLADVWMRETFSIPDNVDPSDPGPLLGDPRLIRGTELWNLDQYELARSEFEDLRTEIQYDPVGIYRLANYLIDLGLYRTAIYCARQVLNLAGMDDVTTMNAPAYFNYLRFGAFYSDMVIPTALEHNFHPLFIFSVLRQESLFEGFVRSSAGARGLMQIIPATGEDIHNSLGWPVNYTAKDLYRPIVSVRYGVDYLADQYEFFDDGTTNVPLEAVGEFLFPVLAAYNAGPGNARAWKDLAGDDPDLFVEIVRFEETRRYIRGVYENFSIYRRLYDQTP